LDRRLLLAGLLVLAIVLAGCTVEDEGLLEQSFNRERSMSKIVTLDIQEQYAWVEFKLDSDLAQGSTSVYIFDPQGNRYTLGIALTIDSNTVSITEPTPGAWKFEVHVDGDSQHIVTGKVRLSWRNKKQGN